MVGEFVVEVESVGYDYVENGETGLVVFLLVGGGGGLEKGEGLRCRGLL